jgi:hypothetical protein
MAASVDLSSLSLEELKRLPFGGICGKQHPEPPIPDRREQLK